MFAHVLVECHRLQDDALVYLTGVKQVEPVVLPPLGKADVTGVEPVLPGDNGQDVTVTNHAEGRSLSSVELAVWDVSYDAPLFLPFVLAYKSLCRLIVFQHGIILRMLAHVVEVDALRGGEGSLIRCNLAHEALAFVAANPLGEVVVTRGILVEPAVAIADKREIVAVVRKVGAALPVSKRESESSLDEGRAVQFAKVHHEPFRLIDFQGLPHIGDADELLGIPKVERGGGFALPLLQQFHDAQAVALGIQGGERNDKECGK